MTYKIEVIDAISEKVVQTFETSTLRAAERIDSGLNINLDHVNFYTRIVDKRAEIGKSMP